MKKFTITSVHIRSTFIVFAFLLLSQQQVYASAFGQGAFGEDVPFGSGTSIGMTFSGDVAFTLTPAGATFSGQGSNTVTVTSTNVVGYYLFLYANGSTSMSNGSATIAASGNGSPASLAINTWGYNVDGSTNYLGILDHPVQILSADGPYKNGNDTDVYYGAYVDITKPASDYTVEVTHTLVGKFD